MREHPNGLVRTHRTVLQSSDYLDQGQRVGMEGYPPSSCWMVMTRDHTLLLSVHHRIPLFPRAPLTPVHAPDHEHRPAPTPRKPARTHAGLPLVVRATTLFGSFPVVGPTACAPAAVARACEVPWASRRGVHGRLWMPQPHKWYTAYYSPQLSPLQV